MFTALHCGVSRPTKCMSKLKVAYNNIYCNILGFKRHNSASAMFVNNRIDTFEARFRKNMLHIWTKIIFL